MEATQPNRLPSKEHYNALKNRKEELERVIEEKEAELRRIKLREAVSFEFVICKFIVVYIHIK